MQNQGGKKVFSKRGDFRIQVESPMGDFNVKTRQADDLSNFQLFLSLSEIVDPFLQQRCELGRRALEQCMTAGTFSGVFSLNLSRQIGL